NRPPDFGIALELKHLPRVLPQRGPARHIELDRFVSPAPPLHGRRFTRHGLPPRMTRYVPALPRAMPQEFAAQVAPAFPPASQSAREFGRAAAETFLLEAHRACLRCVPGPLGCRVAARTMPPLA